MRRFALLIPLALSASTAFAQDIPPTSTAQPAISLTRAIEIAEKHLGGNATEASLSQTDRSVRYEVDVQKGMHEYQVYIDAKTGQVIGAAPDVID
jgi:uncharacterized membrane protein YkoI